jgi:hypothetical protein
MRARLILRYIFENLKANYNNVCFQVAGVQLPGRVGLFGWDHSTSEAWWEEMDCAIEGGQCTLPGRYLNSLKLDNNSTPVAVSGLYSL